jgi:hypothetical protein
MAVGGGERGEFVNPAGAGQGVHSSEVGAVPGAVQVFVEQGLPGR